MEGVQVVVALCPDAPQRGFEFVFAEHAIGLAHDPLPFRVFLETSLICRKRL